MALLVGFEAVFAQFLVKRSPVNGQDFGGSRLVAARPPQGSLHERLFKGSVLAFNPSSKGTRSVHFDRESGRL
jgi:hypothetical protein